MADEDLSEFFRYSRPKRPPCRVGHAIETLEISKADAKRLQAAFDTDKNLITGAAIVEWFKKRGYDFPNAAAITSHRKRTCTCYSD